VFFDPRAGAEMAQVVRGKNIYGGNFEVCPPHAGGMLVIFPSWLMHEVKAMLNNTVGPRIAISFNVVFQP
jgi:ethanolamine utilization microcompartment shell protein EutL